MSDELVFQVYFLLILSQESFANCRVIQVIFKAVIRLIGILILTLNVVNVRRLVYG